MGKIIFKIFSILFILPYLFVDGQDFKITYEIKYKPKVSDTIFSKEIYFLDFVSKENRSVFYAKNLIETPFNSIVTKDFKHSKFEKMEFISTNLFKLSYKSPSDWVLMGNKKKVLSYNCSNAIIDFGGRKWDAWFTNELSINDGPYKFYGLPGLILQIKSIDGDYEFNALSFEKTDKILSLNAISVVDFKTMESQLKYKKQYIKDPTIGNKRSSESGIYSIAYYNGKETSEIEYEKYLIKKTEQFIQEHDNPIEKNDIWVK